MEHLGLAALKLAREEVPEPALQERDDAAEEKDPDAPHGGPEAAAGALAHGPGVEAVVDEVLEVLAHADLAHEAVLVAVHAGELPDMAEGVLEAVSELEGVDVAQAELDVAVYHQLGEAEDLTANCTRIRGGGCQDDFSYSREEAMGGVLNRGILKLFLCVCGGRGHSRWKAFPKRLFLRSFVVSVFTGFRLKL